MVEYFISGMLKFLFMLATIAICSPLASKLRVLVASTRHSRAQRLPSLESVISSFDSAISTLSLPPDYSAAYNSMIALVESARELEVGFKDWSKLAIKKLKSQAKQLKQTEKLLKRALDRAVQLVQQAVEVHSVVYASSQLLPPTRESASKTLDGLKILSSQVANLREASDSHAIIRLTGNVDKDSGALRSGLAEMGERWLCSFVQTKLDPKNKALLSVWWRFVTSVIDQWINLSLAVVHLRSGIDDLNGAENIGDSHVIMLSPRLSTAVTIGSALVDHELYETSHLSSSERGLASIIWEQIRDELNYAKDAFHAEAAHLNSEDLSGYMDSLDDHQDFLFTCLQMFSEFRALLRF